METKKILVVEDEWVIADALCKAMKKLNYTVLPPVSSGAEAIKQIELEKPDLVLMDIILQGEMDGIETASLIEAGSNIPVIYLTAYTERNFIERAKLTKPFSYLVKPFNENELQCNIEIALHKHTIETTLEGCCKRIQKELKGTINALSETIEIKTLSPAGHHQRVAKLAAAIAKELCMKEDKVQGLELAAAVYDIGLVSLPTEFLRDIGKLKDSGLALYQTYPVIGHGIIKKIEFHWPIANIILQHRECYDGSGFPLQIKGKDILIEARILAVADAMEHMTTNKSYRDALTIEQALKEISEESGARFDPGVLDACLRLFKEKGYKMEC
jgi:putative two-component system response regulator